MEPIVLISQACSQMDSNISTWGSCIMESWFMNSPEMLGIFLYVLFAVTIYKMRMPLSIIIVTNLLLSFILASWIESNSFSMLFTISVILAMGAIAIALIERFGRQ